MKTQWTEPSDEVKQCFSENVVAKYETEYFPDNRKRWTIITEDKNKFVFEQFFDVGFFRN